MRILLDTNAYSALRRGHDFVAAQIRQADEVLLSAIVAGELLYGFRYGSRYQENVQELQRFLGEPNVRLLPVTLKTAEIRAPPTGDLPPHRRPKIAVPIRTCVAPSSIATSKSSLMPIESQPGKSVASGCRAS